MSGRRPLLLFVGLLALGLVYIALFAFFTTRSVDFVSAGKIAETQGSRFAANTLIEVGQGRPGSTLLVSGWHQPEAWGAWSREGNVTLFVPRCAGTREAVTRVRLVIGAVADALQQPGLRLSWKGSGAAATDSGPILQAPRALDVAVPEPGCPAGAEDESMLLQIETATPRSPKALGTGEDGRALGFALNSIEFATAGSAGP